MIKRIDFRHILLSVFSFSMVTTLAFFAAKSISQSNAYTSGFNAGNIITDAAMRDYNSLSESDIQTFLKSKNSCNDSNLSKTSNNVDYLSENSPYSWHVKDGHYVCMADETFSGGTAAHIIYRAAQDYHINPKVLIVLLEKEQSLVRDTFPNSVQYRSATGFGCPDTAACDSKYYGLNNQIRNAASMFNDVLNGGWTNYPIGWNYIQYNPNSACGGSNVYIQNLATSALYRYTPYQPGGDSSQNCAAYGNINFYNFYTDWFGSTQQVFKASDLDNSYIPEGNYYIRTLTGKALDVDSYGTKNGTNIQIWEYSGNNAQIFKISRTSDGFYRIVYPHANKSLDVNGASVLPGANIQLWESHDGCAQKWAISINADGHYVFRNACSGNALDVYGANISTDGTNVDTWNYHTGVSEQWDLVRIENGAVADDSYNFISSRGKALDVYGASSKDGANLNIWNAHKGASQTFTLTRSADGFYTITSPYAKKALDVSGASVNAGANVQLWASNNTCAQKWDITKNSNDTYSLRNACGGNALDIYGGNTDINGSNVDVWNYHGGESEQWILLSSDNTLGSLLSGKYIISSALSDKQSLDIYNNSRDSGANVESYKTHGEANQLFTFQATDDSYYRIVNPASKKSLDVSGASKLAGANVQIWSNNDTCAQKWFIIPAGSSYYIRNACSGNALDLYGGRAYSGANIDVWDFHAGNSEKWNIIKQ